uniref:Uncharacterized protein yceH n=1 Tax=Anthurium amnicola TaxID=1678845 RepID=A0A1D1XVN4_9ARAE
MGPDGSVDLVEEGRLRSFFLQLRTESGILDRMIYKNKNQHRRCSYFQSLLKVRRDVRLLLSVGLEEILNSAFQVIHGKNPSQRLYLLERLKERHSGGKHNFQERLLGVTRLLSQMVEPILRAAIQISSLLARTFFMAFSLTILSLLARLRVLVQQMLVDTVSVFNRVTSVSQKRHTVKLTKNGVEAFREYYPPSWDVISLDCSWQGDKFVLLEGTQVMKLIPGRCTKILLSKSWHYPSLKDIRLVPLQILVVQTLPIPKTRRKPPKGELLQNHLTMWAQRGLEFHLRDLNCMTHVRQRRWRHLFL